MDTSFFWRDKHRIIYWLVGPSIVIFVVWYSLMLHVVILRNIIQFYVYQMISYMTYFTMLNNSSHIMCPSISNEHLIYHCSSHTCIQTCEWYMYIIIYIYVIIYIYITITYIYICTDIFFVHTLAHKVPKMYYTSGYPPWGPLWEHGFPDNSQQRRHPVGAGPRAHCPIWHGILHTYIYICMYIYIYNIT